VQVFSHKPRIAFLGALIAFAATASPAMAASGSCQAPPGTSAIDQYCEALPSPGGTGGNHKHKRSHHVNNTTSQELKKQGAAGQAVLNLANSSGSAATPAPTPAPAVRKHVKRKVHHQKKKKHQAAAQTPKAGAPPTAPVQHGVPASAPSGNPLSAVGSAIGTGSSGGTAFITLLIAIAVLMGATAFVGRRRRTGEN
jgi:hypothetical protein